VSAPAVQQIADWLEKLGMSEYAQRFADNDIDIDVLNGDSKINGLCGGLDRLSDLHNHEHDRQGCTTVPSGALTRTWEPWPLPLIAISKRIG
jgi:hypothetical protein